ncbi:helix-turn-helix domain-containing protein [Gordonia amicalis]|uniref:Helix-turn-helix domain-containing protein n=1 Tax=Gordonia amicalis TaxID=89053 RepID=A0ABU4DHZ5_9ACTN|nr:MULTISPECIES: helix-turn-helix domain-containing protein [Gordonia]ATD72435.1 XRE family transcriptional regulator [Gordonia sp. 1D]MBA5848455.1 helix-turn-helix domain-containing protein [Gordonia amicalis]MDV6309367.1 helix-turn-helix domain-containing protein [Gordonia amicalis]MDV7101198.1 helix-turn-helix domain-containing protein [Gordonia amicalis]MDV7175798.1 helix-turn-helix domain-containing protein [Gordonia amicalis]
MALEEPDAAQASLGAEIRRRRKQQDTTLANLAAQAGISHSFLSQLERGYARPSMTTLERIARALGTTQVSLMLAADPGRAGNAPADAPPGAQIVRADQGAVLPQTGDDAGHARLLVNGDAAFYPQEHALGAREFGDFYRHEQDEWLHVVSGEIEVDLSDGRIVELRTGDSLYYAGGIPHRWRLVGPDVAHLIVVQASS